jgi:hypothetical protein
MGDYARRQDKSGSIPVIAELLDKQQDFVSRFTWTPANEGHEHRSLFRTSLPTVDRLSPNNGYPLSKSEATPVIDTCTAIGVAMEVDKRVADSYGEPGELMASEGHAFVEAMSQKCAYDLLYGSRSTDKDNIDGLFTRYNASTGNIGRQVIKGGGSGSDNTSIFFGVLGPQTIHGIYPKGMQMGLKYDKRGEQTVTLSNGNRQIVYQDFFTWDFGLVVKNTGAGCRICNIDVSDLSGGTAADLYLLMTQAYHRVMKFKNMGKAVCLMNPTVYQWLDVQSRTDQAYTLTRETVEGREVTSFRGFEILPTDTLANNEATIA